MTCGFAGSRPAPSRRPRAVSSGCGVARRRARAQACRTARSTDLQFVPVLTSFFAARMLPSAPAELAVRHPTRAFTRGHPRHSPGAPVPIARRPSARPASRLLRALLAMRCPGSGPSVRPSGSRLWTVAPVLPRVSARQPEPTAGWRDCPRLRSLLAANQWIAETSAVVEPILRRPSPHSLPIESLLVPEAKARPISSRARKRGVPATQGGRGGDRGPRPDHSGRQHGEPTRGLLAERGQARKARKELAQDRQRREERRRGWALASRRNGCELAAASWPMPDQLRMPPLPPVSPSLTGRVALPRLTTTLRPQPGTWFARGWRGSAATSRSRSTLIARSGLLAPRRSPIDGRRRPVASRPPGSG